METDSDSSVHTPIRHWENINDFRRIINRKDFFFNLREGFISREKNKK